MVEQCPQLVAGFIDQMNGGQHQEEATCADPGLRILARMIARSLAATQRDTKARRLNEADVRGLDARDAGMQKRRPSWAGNGEGM